MEGTTVCLIDQNALPFEFRIMHCRTYRDTCLAIRDMTVRGAGAIGAAAGYAMAQAFLQAKGDDRASQLEEARSLIEATRPTARNLFYAVERVFAAGKERQRLALEAAEGIADEDARASHLIGMHGKALIGDNSRIATHCNAGWLAFVDYGTALSPVYLSYREGKKLFVYASETRPRGQGARLTAWELRNAGIPHVIIADHAMAWYMARGMVDLVIVGADRIAANGDVANKIGTLDKAVNAQYFGIPFYVAAPRSTFDSQCRTGREIVIEERDPDEVLYQEGLTAEGKRERIRVASPESPALNPAFDVTPARLITGFITEEGIISTGGL